jgi:quinol monooxygenase YgiN
MPQRELVPMVGAPLALGVLALGAHICALPTRAASDTWCSCRGALRAPKHAAGALADGTETFHSSQAKGQQVQTANDWERSAAMVVEIAEFTAAAGKEEELRAGLVRGIEVVRRAEGCRSAQVQRCVEESGQFVGIIEWATLEDHTVTFRGGPLFPEYRSHINGLFEGPVRVRHYEAAEP